MSSLSSISMHATKKSDAYRLYTIFLSRHSMKLHLARVRSGEGNGSGGQQRDTTQ